MDRKSKAVEKFLQGMACSQAILSEYGTVFGLSSETAMKIAAGFAAGMRRANVCGAITGAYMTLGLKYSGQNCQESAGRKDVYKAIAEFNQEFEKIHGTLSCKELLGCDISTPEGMKTAIESNLFKTICPKFLGDAADLLEKI